MSVQFSSSTRIALATTNSNASKNDTTNRTSIILNYLKLLMKQTDTWINNPTKKQMIIVLVLALTGLLFLTLSMTNFFTENIFQGKYLVLYFLVIGAVLTTYKVCRNYFRNKKIN